VQPASPRKIPVFQPHEKEKNKKDKYNHRVIDIDKSSFNPLVFTSGGMAPESNRVNKRLAEKIAEKRREPYHLSYTNIHKDKDQTCPFGQFLAEHHKGKFR